MQQIYTSHQLSSLVSYVIRSPLLHWKFWGLFLAHGDWDMFMAGDLIQRKHMTAHQRWFQQIDDTGSWNPSVSFVSAYTRLYLATFEALGSLAPSLELAVSLGAPPKQHCINMILWYFVNICEQSLCVWQYQAHWHPASAFKPALL